MLIVTLLLVVALASGGVLALWMQRGDLSPALNSHAANSPSMLNPLA